MEIQKISVIIPVYNIENYLERCLESVIMQTYNNLEIICINDGSTDGSLSILEDYAIRDDRIIIIDQSNLGLSAARNKGIESASGEYITFIDSDDWVEIDMVEQLYSLILHHNCDITLCSYIRSYDEKEFPKFLDMPKKIIFNENETHQVLLRKMIGPIGEELRYPENLDSLVTAWGKLYKTSLIKENKIKFIDTREIGTEDLLFNVQYLLYAKKSGVINIPLYHYWKGNSTSLTSCYKENLHIQWKKKYEYIRDLLKVNNVESIYYQALNNRICLATLGLGLNEIHIEKISDIGRRIRKYRFILNEEHIKTAFKNLNFKHLPLHWRMFYTFNKYKLSAISVSMLLGINFLRKHKK